MTKTTGRKTNTITLYRLVEGFRQNGLPLKARIKRVQARVTEKRYWPESGRGSMDLAGVYPAGLDREDLPVGIGTDPLEVLEAAVEASAHEVIAAEVELQRARDIQRKRLELWAELREKVRE